MSLHLCTGPEKYREHGSTAPRKGSSSQEEWFVFEYWQEADQTHCAAPRKQNYFSGPGYKLGQFTIMSQPIRLIWVNWLNTGN